MVKVRFGRAGGTLKSGVVVQQGTTTHLKITQRLICTVSSSGYVS